MTYVTVSPGVTESVPEGLSPHTLPGKIVIPDAPETVQESVAELPRRTEDVEDVKYSITGGSVGEGPISTTTEAVASLGGLAPSCTAIT
jgi:hypothetical protein